MEVNIVIEYCGICNFKSHCDDLTNVIKHSIPSANVICKQGRRGSFEVTVNDKLIHSKLSSLAHPDYDDVARVIQNAKDGKEIKKVKEQPIKDCMLM